MRLEFNTLSRPTNFPSQKHTLTCNHTLVTGPLLAQIFVCFTWLQHREIFACIPSDVIVAKKLTWKLEGRWRNTLQDNVIPSCFWFNLEHKINVLVKVFIVLTNFPSFNTLFVWDQYLITKKNFESKKIFKNLEIGLFFTIENCWKRPIPSKTIDATKKICKLCSLVTM